MDAPIQLPEKPRARPAARAGGEDRGPVRGGAAVRGADPHPPAPHHLPRRNPLRDDRGASGAPVPHPLWPCAWHWAGSRRRAGQDRAQAEPHRAVLIPVGRVHHPGRRGPIPARHGAGWWPRSPTCDSHRGPARRIRCPPEAERHGPRRQTRRAVREDPPPGPTRRPAGRQPGSRAGGAPRSLAASAWEDPNHLEGRPAHPGAVGGSRSASRMFLTADGESGRSAVLRPSASTKVGILAVKTRTLVPALGDPPGAVGPGRLRPPWRGVVGPGGRTPQYCYDIDFDPIKGRWYLDASWGYGDVPVPGPEALQSSGVVGVDLNADHLAACRLDASGNPVEHR